VLGREGREDLEDARQAIFLRTFANLDKWDGQCPFCKWLAVVAARRSIDLAQATETSVPLSHDVPDLRPASSPPGVAECIEKTLSQLPPDWRRAFDLGVQGAPREEIARAVGRSVRTVHYWLAEIRERLQHCLEP
jgi:DNA-directed RNA polymerase specialized sigma24 family protein